MKHPFRIAAIGLLPLLTLVLGWQLGTRYEAQKLVDQKENLEFYYTGGVGSGQTVTDPRDEVELSLLWSVWRILLNNYIEPQRLDTEKMLYGLVSGAVDAIGDPYTVFMTPKENTDFRNTLKGELQGIGAELTQRDDLIVVVAPLKGSPAQRAGLMPEDIIVEVDGESIEGQSLNQVVQKIRGPKGTQVTLTIYREGEDVTRDITITRDEITVPSTEYEILETGSGGIGYIALNQFANRTTTEVEQALESFRGTNLEGIILDVRFNGGGYLERAVDLTSMFMKQGKVVSVARREGQPDVHHVYGQPIDAETPMVVLINEGSASASEIVAGALQDYNRATVIGKKSFGKGTIQEIFELPGGSSLRVTIAKWLTPNGRDLAKEGIEPDIEVDRTLEHYENDEDPQLDSAIEWLTDGQIINMVQTGSTLSNL